MHSKLMGIHDDERTFVVVLDPGEEAMAALAAFAAQNRIGGASISAIGAFERATVGWFDPGAKRYQRIPVEVQCEVLSALGDIAQDANGTPSLHLHAVLGLSDGSTRGGHLIDAVVRPTLEAIIAESPTHLRRLVRPDLGVALIDLSK